MRKTLYIAAFFLSVLLGFSSCTERIDIKLDGTYTRLVVDGVITSDAKKHRIKLSTTTDYFYNQPAPAVRNAIVTINDGTNTLLLTENPLLPGIYETNEDFFGVAGKTYKLEIQLSSPINGKSNYEAFSEMPDVNPIDSIRLKYIPHWEGVAIQAYAQDPIGVNFYMFNVFKNSVLLTDTLNKVSITDDKLFDGNYTNGIPVAFLDQKNVREKINPGDTITLQIAGITGAYYYFVTDLQTDAGFSNPLFGGPPANVRGNINNGAIGFFAAYSVRYGSIIAR